MMRQYELVERVLKYDPSANEALLNRAYVYAMKAHGNQKRASGDPYFSHPLEVAAILTELKLDDATIAAALLHDVIEDTDVTRAEIDQKFGKEIGALVDGLTKIKKLDLVTKKAEQAENFRKLLVAISSDIRVLLIKLADRLHNMRTLEHMRPESRAARFRGDARDLCAAGRPHGHAGHARGARGAGLQVGQPGGLPDRDRQARGHRTSATRGWSRRSRPRSRPSSPRRASKPRCMAARKSRSRSGARWRTGRSRWSSCRTSTAFASSSAASMPATARSASCMRPGARCPAASRTTSRRRSRTTTSRSTPPSSARATSASSCRSAPRTCIASPNTAWPRTRSTRMAAQPRTARAPTAARRRSTRKTPTSGCGAWSTRCSKATTPRSSSSTPSSSCSRTRCSASRPRAA